MRRRVDLNHVGAAEHAQIRRTPAVVRLVVKVLLVCAGYYAGAIAGISFGFPPAGISTIWPPNAIVLAALLLEPPRAWWVYALAALPTHLHVVATFQPGVTLPVMFSQFAGNAVHILVAAAAVRVAASAPPRFDSLRGMASFILFAAIGATAVAAVVAVGLFVLIGWVTDFWLAWRQRFFSNGFAVLTITPPIVLALAGELVGARRPRGRRYAELALVIIGLVAAGTIVFGPEAPSADIMPALLVAPLPFVLYAALRLGPGGVCIALLAVTFVSWTAVYAGRWPFTTPSPAYNVLSVHAFLLTISIPMMFLAAVVEERRRTDETTRRQRDELAHALRVTTLGELVASIAHELNQPLSALMTNAQAGRRLLDADHSSHAIRKVLGDTREILGDVVEEANRAAQIIRRLQALFRKERAERVALDINALIDNVIGLVGADFQQKGIVMRFVRNETSPLVLGDPVQLQQVVLNLLINAGEAVAAIDDVRMVSVDLDRSGPGRLMFSVRDTGIGVTDPAELERIFEHFVSSKPQGLGMGLTISRSIVEAHGGRIWAVANDDRGLTLHVELPALTARQLPFTHV
jgi:signal transduction histidine kinase